MHCRFLYLVGQLTPGGLERQLCYLLQAMDRERYRPAVAVWNFSEADVYVPRIRALNVPVYAFPNMPSAPQNSEHFAVWCGNLNPKWSIPIPFSRTLRLIGVSGVHEQSQSDQCGVISPWTRRSLVRG